MNFPSGSHLFREAGEMQVDAVHRGRPPRLLARRAAFGLVAGLLLSAALACSLSERSTPTAEIIFENAAVYTMDSARSWADAVAIAGGKILRAGSAAVVRKLAGPQTRVMNLGGKMVLPGFQDSHIHLVTGGIELGQCRLGDLPDAEAIYRAVREYAAANPGREWVLGGGWELPAFPDAGPRKEDLDRLVPDRPAFLSAADGHSAWCNSRALALAGITGSTRDPKGGRIERSKGGREPSGTLRESAMRMVSEHIPEPAASDYLQGLEAGVAFANRFGITSIVEASATGRILEAYAELDRRDRLTARVLASLHVDPGRGADQIAELARARERFQGRRLRSAAAKIFADGVLESGTAALLEPYLNRAGSSGEPLLEPEPFKQLAAALAKAGFQIHVHAIGDYAVRMSLDAIEYAQRTAEMGDGRHHIAHLELIHPQDIPRFRALRVAANFQPLWAYADLYITKLTEPALGPARSRWLYPIGSVARSGALVVGGSDWSVSSMNPLDAIQVAVTRRGLEEFGGPAWIPEEIADLPVMLAAYTINGAYLAHQEDIRGSIETGKAADLIILDRNLFKIPVGEVHKARVLLTLLEGQEVYRDPAFQ